MKKLRRVTYTVTNNLIIIYKFYTIFIDDQPEESTMELECKMQSKNKVAKWNEFESSTILFKKNTFYPDGFPKLTKLFDEITLDETCFARLFPYKSTEQYLSDPIINAFFTILPKSAEKKGLTLVPFDSYFYEKILEEKFISKSFFNYAKKQNVNRKNLWLIPINIRNMNHWSLLLVRYTPSRK